MPLIPSDSTILEHKNCKVTYEAEFLTTIESQDLYNYLLNNLNWTHDTATIYGKKIITKRKIAWFADFGADYNYSGSSRIADTWDIKILEIKKKLEQHSGFTFNSCLLNLYHTGGEGMGWHSDDQNHLETGTAVAIISLGSERFFKLRETKARDKQHKLLLEQGSLLVMQGQTQVHYQHEIPKMMAITSPRISLTWRTMK